MWPVCADGDGVGLSGAVARRCLASGQALSPESARTPRGYGKQGRALRDGRGLELLAGTLTSVPSRGPRPTPSCTVSDSEPDEAQGP